MQLGQLWQNLLSNALKFRQSDRAPHIQINSRQLTPGEQPTNLAFPLVASPATAPVLWELSIEDNGIGIPAEYKERIFQVFNGSMGKINTKVQGSVWLSANG